MHLAAASRVSMFLLWDISAREITLDELAQRERPQDHGRTRDQGPGTDQAPRTKDRLNPVLINPLLRRYLP